MSYCSSCGARRGHLGGCPEAIDPPGGKRKKNPSPADKTHRHDYTVTRTATRTEGDEVITYKFQKCLNNADGKCPQPDNIEVTRLPRRRK